MPPSGSAARRSRRPVGVVDTGVATALDQALPATPSTDDGTGSTLTAQLLELRLREAGVDVTLEITPGGHSVADKLPLLVDWLLDASS